MAAEFWVRAGGVWRKAQQVWFRSGGVWRQVTKGYFRSGGVWRLVHDPVSLPELFNVSASSLNGTDVSSVSVNWSMSGVLTGWTLTIDVGWNGGGYLSTPYTGTNGGSPVQILSYWGGASSTPAFSGERLSSDAILRVSLINGLGTHAIGSPAILGPGIPL